MPRYVRYVLPSVLISVCSAVVASLTNSWLWWGIATIFMIQAINHYFMLRTKPEATIKTYVIAQKSNGKWAVTLNGKEVSSHPTKQMAVAAGKTYAQRDLCRVVWSNHDGAVLADYGV